MFQGLILVCCFTEVIAATQADGGLVSLGAQETEKLKTKQWTNSFTRFAYKVYYLSSCFCPKK